MCRGCEGELAHNNFPLGTETVSNPTSWYCPRGVNRKAAEGAGLATGRLVSHQSRLERNCRSDFIIKKAKESVIPIFRLENV